MLTLSEAKQIAEHAINKTPIAIDDTLVIIEEAIVEIPYAWIFP